jgi:hypothetical protein
VPHTLNNYLTVKGWCLSCSCCLYVHPYTLQQLVSLFALRRVQHTQSRKFLDSTACARAAVAIVCMYNAAV